MAFYSILFEKHEVNRKEETFETPDYFRDLNLDQIIESITALKEEYHLTPFFYTPLHDSGEIQYRQEIMQDLEEKAVFDPINVFAQQMREMREHLAIADRLYYPYQKKSWFLDAVAIYCQNVNRLVQDLSAVELKSRGLIAFREYLDAYLRSERFVSLQAEVQKLKADLATIRYCLRIEESRNRIRKNAIGIEVRKYQSEADYSLEVEETFRKFRQGAVKDYRLKLTASEQMNHVEAGILDLVAKLYPDIFRRLDEFSIVNSGFLDETVADFDRQIHFYLAYLEHSKILKNKGLKFCYPKLSAQSKEIYNYEGFDLALANKLIAENSPVVCNDFYLTGQERILIVTGPNQGGKTTFARTIGQLHYLAALGCPVPGTEAQFFLWDRIFTHFEREEKISSQSGKLQDDLLRIQAILKQATPDSLVIINEIFTSTTLQDAVFLSKKIMEKIIDLDLLCVCVTFLDELASFSNKAVSMVGTVVPENPALRTYKIVRRPADGLSYALAIAEKYRLTYHGLKERIRT